MVTGKFQIFKMAGTLEEYDEPTPLRSTYCSRLTEEEYEEETSACTQEALSELIAHLNENPDEYHKVVKRRKKEEAEGAGLVSYVKV